MILICLSVLLSEGLIFAAGAGQEDLSAWLDEVFRQRLNPSLAQTVHLPLGVVEDVQHLTLASSTYQTDAADSAVRLLVARGLQRQAQGDPAGFVDNLASGLALVRQVRHLEPTSVLRLPLLDRFSVRQ